MKFSFSMILFKRIFPLWLLLFSLSGYGNSDSLAQHILQASVLKYKSLDRISFYYQYQVQHLEANAQWKTTVKINSSCLLKQDTDNLWTLTFDKENADMGLKRFQAVLKNMEQAIRNHSGHIFKSCSQMPYYMIELLNVEQEDAQGIKSKFTQTLYIDTISYLIQVVQTPFMNLSAGSELRSFKMDSIKAHIKPKKIPAVFMLNRNMLKPGEMAPKFSLNNTEGKMVQLADYKGKLVLLDFWYAACKPCIKASYELDKLQKEFSNRGLVILGMNTMDKASKIKRHSQKYHMNYSSLLCTREVKSAYKINSYPSFYLIDKTGKIVYSTAGFSSDLSSDLESVILQELSK